MAARPGRLRDERGDLRSATDTFDHREQLPSAGQKSLHHLGADHGQILADDDDITADSAKDVTRMAPAGAGQ